VVFTHVSSPVVRVLAGTGACRLLLDEIERLGASRVVLVSSATLTRETSLPTALEHLLGSRFQQSFSGLAQHTPEQAVAELADLLREVSADAVVSLGGGSVIDGCKGAIHDLGPGAAMHLAIPTTLSGAEFTASAGITRGPGRQKQASVDRQAAPQVVILDPEATRHTPGQLWLGSGIRALDHAVETVCSEVQDPLSNRLALEAIRRLRSSLPRCQADGQDLAARQQAQLGAWWAALGLASVPMGPSHTLGKLLGAPFGIPHGITSCVLLPAVIAATARADPDRVAPLAPAFDVHGPELVAPACAQLIAELGLPRSLSAAGLSQADLPTYLESIPREWREAVAGTF